MKQWDLQLFQRDVYAYSKVLRQLWLLDFFFFVCFLFTAPINRPRPNVSILPPPEGPFLTIAKVDWTKDGKYADGAKVNCSITGRGVRWIQ